MKFCLVLLALALIAQAEKFPEPKCGEEQIACPDNECIDMKIGHCDNHCAMYCNGKDEEICPGKKNITVL